MILDLIRHATAGRDDHLDGRSDPPVDADGTDLICARYADLQWAHVLCSPRQRAVATAEALALPRGLEVITDEEWEELDFGDWDGQPLDALPMQALQAFHLDPHANPPPHGESWGHFERRIARALHRLLDDPEPVPTLVVSHGGALRMVLSQVCGLPMAMCWALRIDHGTRVRLRVEREDGELWGELLELQQAGSRL
jgi:alpha-ribazole phosphatase